LERGGNAFGELRFRKLVFGLRIQEQPDFVRPVAVVEGDQLTGPDRQGGREGFDPTPDGGGRVRWCRLPLPSAPRWAG